MIIFPGVGNPAPTLTCSRPQTDDVWYMPGWGVVGGTVVAESRRPSGRYTVRTTEEAPRPGGCGPPGMMVAGRSLHLDPAPCASP